jgi:spore germination protein YaaH
MLNARSLSIAALAAAGALLPAATAAAAPAAARCAAVAPTHLRVAASKGAADRVVVSWRAPRRHPARLAFRVARDGATVGQTRARRMSVAVPPGQAPKITVTAVVGGRLTTCRATITAAMPAAGSGVVTGIAVRPGAAGRAVISWDAPAGGATAGYRILRDGRLAQRVRRPSLTVRLTRRAVHYQVAALDRAGRRGPRSSAVTVRAGHRRPTAPIGAGASDITDTSLTLSWGPSQAPSGRIAGYRVLRDGRTVKAVGGTSITLPKGGAGRTLSFRVVAVDDAGWASPDSDPITLTTGAGTAAGASAPGAYGPPGPPGIPVADAVGDTTLTLSWAPSALPARAVLRGYRLMRDGVVVGQVAGPRTTLGNLEPKSGHDWTVAAVDTRGVVSEPSPAARIVQAEPVPTTGLAHAFLLASTDSSFAAFRDMYQKIGVVYPTFFDCRTTGEIDGQDNRDIVTFAQDRKVKVLPRFNCQSTSVVHRILTDPALRETWLSGVTDLVARHGYDGANIDFEAVAAADRDAMTSFIAALADRLHAQGKLLSQAVSPKTEDVPNHPRSTAFDYVSLAQHDDYIFVMTWGLHWSTSAPGAQDDIAWVRAVAAYAATMPNHERFVLGTMLYGMDWAGSGGTANPGEGRHYPEVQALAARYGVTPVRDTAVDAWKLAYTDDAGVPHTVWFPDAETIGDRIAIARDNGLGIGFWRLGQEDDRVWSDPRLPVAG